MKTRVARCPYCGKKFVYSEVYKWNPCCSKECFEKRIGVFRMKRGRNMHTFVHDKYCIACGKSVDFFIDKKFCSENCQRMFNVISFKKKGFYIFCLLCGKSFEAKMPKSRFCSKCLRKKEAQCICFDRQIRVKDRDDLDLGDMILNSKESGKSYAELQKEETLKKAGMTIPKYGSEVK